MPIPQQFVIIPSQIDNDTFYVRTGDGTHSDQDVAVVMIVKRNGSSVHLLEVQDFVEKCFKPHIPEWVR